MKDIIAGGISGISQTIVGYPLDTLKVLTQNKMKLNSISLKNLYRGVKYPLQSCVITNSVVFPINKMLKENGYPVFFNGFVAGACITPIVYFFDKLKVNMQIGNNANTSLYKNCKGFSATIARETFAFGIYFYSYDLCKEYYELPIPIAGALAGVSNWSLTYPLDVIRNRQIAMNITIKEACRMGSLFRGLNYCLFRAVIVNSMAFYVYETVYNNI